MFMDNDIRARCDILSMQHANEQRKGKRREKGGDDGKDDEALNV